MTTLFFVVDSNPQRYFFAYYNRWSSFLALLSVRLRYAVVSMERKDAAASKN